MFSFFKNIFNKKEPVAPVIETVRCPFCHQHIVKDIIETHIQQKHLVPLEDGQQKDHVTTPPETRYEGSLENIPQVYFHKKCQVGTGMPEEIIRSYLINPFLYNDYTFCCGCKDYVHGNEVFWMSPDRKHITNETVFQYMRKLRMAYNKRESK